MATATQGAVGQLGGLVIQGETIRTADGGMGWQIELPAGTAGTLTTRTDDDTGVATLESGHGLQNGNTVDAYWDGGRRYDMTATVAGDAITIDGGSGDNLPVQDAAVVVTKAVAITAVFDTGELAAIVVGCDQRTHVRIDGAATWEVDLAAGEMSRWFSGQGMTNPMGDGTTSVIIASNGSSTTAATPKAGIVLDTTP